MAKESLQEAKFMKIRTISRLAYIFILGFILVALSAVSVSAFAPIKFNLLAQGSVDLQRSSWISFQLSSAPKILNQDDLVRSRRGTNPLILCADLSQRRISPGITYRVNQICPRQGTPSVIEDGEGDFLPTSDTRSGSIAGLIQTPNERSRQTNESLPFPEITSPITSQTLSENLVLSNNLTIQWNSVPKAVDYTIRITEPGGTIWNSTTSENHIRYPGIANERRNSISPETNIYSVEVRANTGSNLLDLKRNSGVATFKLIDEITAREISSTIDNINGLDIPNESKTFAIAQIYRQNNLFTEAIFTLETCLSNNLTITETTYSEYCSPLHGFVAGYRLLGDIYRYLSIEEKSLDAYALALFLAEDVDGISERLNAGQFSSDKLSNLAQAYIVAAQRGAITGIMPTPDGTLDEEKAHILAGIGELYLSFGDLQESYSFLQEAKELYISLEGPDSLIAAEIDPTEIGPNSESDNEEDRQLAIRKIKRAIGEQTFGAVR